MGLGLLRRLSDLPSLGFVRDAIPGAHFCLDHEQNHPLCSMGEMPNLRQNEVLFQGAQERAERS
jgi:hypothetical protein